MLLRQEHAKQARRQPDRPAEVFAQGRCRKSDFGKTLEAYRALEDIAQGLARSAPSRSSNFAHGRAPLTKACLMRPRSSPPSTRIELHPYFQQPEVQAFNAEASIVTQAWSPIGGITTSTARASTTSTLEDPTVILKIAESRSKRPRAGHAALAPAGGTLGHPEDQPSPAASPKNFDVFDFELTTDEGRGHRRTRHRQARRSRARTPSPSKSLTAEEIPGEPDHDDQHQHTGQGRLRQSPAHLPVSARRQPPAPWQQTATACALRWPMPSSTRITTLRRRTGPPGPPPSRSRTSPTATASLPPAAASAGELGTASVLINNAFSVMLLGPFDSGQRADYRQMIEVNLLGAITTTEVFLDKSSRTAAATSATSRRSPGELTSIR